MKFTILKIAGFAAAFAFATVAGAQTPGSSTLMAASGSPSYGNTTGPTLPNSPDTGGMAASPNATEQTASPKPTLRPTMAAAPILLHIRPIMAQHPGADRWDLRLGVRERVPVLRAPPVALRALPVDQRSQP